MQTIVRFKQSALRQAVLVLVALAAGPAHAAIVTSGLVSPDPTSGSVAGNLNVGTSGVESVTVNGGSSLNTQRITGVSGVSGDGSIVVTGTGSTITTNFGVVGYFFNANIGSQGKGSLSVLDGGSFIFGTNDATCQAACRLFLSNGAGSDGTLTVSGAGSNVSGVGGIRVGYASLFNATTSGFDYGTAGGTSTGQASVLAGGSVTSSFLDMGHKDLTSSLTGTETVTAHGVVDGIGSVWNLVRNVVSRTQIERQLGRAIELSEIASSFADIERALV
jgi:hypothetical protein